MPRSAAGGRELVLAHVNNDRTETAYRLTDLPKRCRVVIQQRTDYFAATA